MVGVDVVPQPRYPFEFHQGDALERLGWLLNSEPRRFDAIHASPICKLYSPATPAWARANHPNQIPPTREALIATGIPWVMENVPQAPLRPDIDLCGCQVGLPELERKRRFEIGGWSVPFELRPPCNREKSAITVAGHGEPSGPRMARGVTAHKADWERAMGIDWMTRDELAQAIPPAYTEFIGSRLLAALEVAA